MAKEVEKGPAGSQSPSQKRYIDDKVYSLDRFTFFFHLRFDFFRKASSTSSGSHSHETAQVAFKLYDRDKDGYITKAEMVKISKTLTKEQVEKVIFVNGHEHKIKREILNDNLASLV